MRVFYRVGPIGYLVGAGANALHRRDERQVVLARQRLARGQDPEGVPADLRKVPKRLIWSGIIILFTLGYGSGVFGLIGIAITILGMCLLKRRQNAADQYHIQKHHLDELDAAEGWQ